MTLTDEKESIGKIIIYDELSLEITPETWNNKLRKQTIKLIDKRIKELEK